MLVDFVAIWRLESSSDVKFNVNSRCPRGSFRSSTNRPIATFWVLPLSQAQLSKHKKLCEHQLFQGGRRSRESDHSRYSVHTIIVIDTLDIQQLPHMNTFAWLPTKPKEEVSWRLN